MRKRCVTGSLIVIGILFMVPTSAAADRPALEPGQSLDHLKIILTAGEYTITRVGGKDRIEMDGFGHRMEPGKPMLPAKRFLIGLPPGARVRSIETREMGATELPGTFEIDATPSSYPLADPTQIDELLGKARREWQQAHDTSYGSNEAYPREIVESVGRGTIRKYSYACVSFCPFRFHPQSARLIHYHQVEVNLAYTLPATGTIEADEVEKSLWDTLADERAAQLLINFDEIRDAYIPGGPPPTTPRSTHDYVIITTPLLSTAVTASDFLPWKSGLGHNVRIVLTTDTEIVGQGGEDLSEQIRNFLRNNYLDWGIEYVLLVGSYAGIPMPYCFPNANDHTHDPLNYPSCGGSVPTDYCYADLSYTIADSWDSDSDGYPGEYGDDDPDFAAEIYVGRIPTDNPGRVRYALDKSVAFEQDTGSWKNNALHAGAILFYENQNHEDIPKIDGATLQAHIESDFMSEWTVSRYSEREGLDPSDYIWPPISQDAFTADWRAGQYAVVNWSGHGAAPSAHRFVWVWDDGDGIPETDGSDGIDWSSFIADYASLEDDHPSIVFAVSCNVGYPEPNGDGNLGIDLLTDVGFGSSIGVVSATRTAHISRDWVSMPGGTESMCYEFNRHLIDGPTGPARIGNALYDSKLYCYVNYGWESYGEHKDQFDFNLYGDPALDRRGITAAALEGNIARAGTPIYMMNHPNPFASATKITYQLPGEGWVRLDVLDPSGRKISTLVDGYQRAGRKTIVWNATDRLNRRLPSGLYFYRIRAEGISRTHRMIVLD